MSRLRRRRWEIGDGRWGEARRWRAEKRGARALLPASCLRGCAAWVLTAALEGGAPRRAPPPRSDERGYTLKREQRTPAASSSRLCRLGFWMAALEGGAPRAPRPHALTSAATRSSVNNVRMPPHLRGGAAWGFGWPPWKAALPGLRASARLVSSFHLSLFTFHFSRTRVNNLWDAGSLRLPKMGDGRWEMGARARTALGSWLLAETGRARCPQRAAAWPHAPTTDY